MHPETDLYTIGTGSLKQWGESGGPTGYRTGYGQTPPFDVFGFSNAQAGGSAIRPLVLEFEHSLSASDNDRPPATDIRFKLYDPDEEDRTAGRVRSDLQTILGTGATYPWTFLIGLTKDWVHPGDLATPVESNRVTGSSTTSSVWTAAEYNDEDAGTLLATLAASISGGGNDASSHLLTQHSANPRRWFLNYFLYLAVKPHSNAAAGLHSEWGWRVNYIFPGQYYS